MLCETCLQVILDAVFMIHCSSFSDYSVRHLLVEMVLISPAFVFD